MSTRALGWKPVPDTVTVWPAAVSPVLGVTLRTVPGVSAKAEPVWRVSDTVTVANAASALTRRRLAALSAISGNTSHWEAPAVRAKRSTAVVLDYYEGTAAAAPTQ